MTPGPCSTHGQQPGQAKSKPLGLAELEKPNLGPCHNSFSPELWLQDMHFQIHEEAGGKGDRVKDELRC